MYKPFSAYNPGAWRSERTRWFCTGKSRHFLFETSQQLKISVEYMHLYSMHDFNRLMSAMSIDGIWQNNLID